ncbi:MAG TPA: hypothetical protein PLG97_01040 [Alcaligenes sp.]|nr:hypothetical protein [Alcaligenes sp.]HRL26077.1 hypothetical protein [Alcaligenes sp.]
MIEQLLWMVFCVVMAAIMIWIGVALEWRDFLPYLVVVPLLVAAGGFVSSYRGFLRYWRAWPEQRLYQSLHAQGVQSQPAAIVHQEELLPGVFKSAYPLLRLSLDVAGRQTHVDVLVQPELSARFRPGRAVAVLCDPDVPERCALDREHVVLQDKPASNSYGD